MVVAKKSTGRSKHIPMRRCIACRNSFPKRTLVRIVRSKDEGVLVDPSGKKAGRGAYLCDNPLCWERVLTSENLLARALNGSVSPDARAALSAYYDREFKEKPGRVAEG
jgi:predicted RNA-binding protein YlxR (DUF448 family)